MADFSQLIADVQAVIRENGRQLITGPVLQSALIEIINTINADKQDTISDLDDIRAGALLGATAYQLPASGIPASDLAAGVQVAIWNASAHGEWAGQVAMFDDEGFFDGSGIDASEVATHAEVDAKYTKPAGGIPFEDFEHSVQVSLENADNALQPNSDYDGQIPVYNFDGYIEGSGITPGDVNAKYVLPVAGIPLGDLSSGVQASLTLADNAMQPDVDAAGQLALFDGDGYVHGAGITPADVNNKADKDGTYPDLTAGAVLGAPVPAEFAYRGAPYGGSAVVDTVLGNSVKWNQLCKNDASFIFDEATFNNGIYTCTPTSGAYVLKDASIPTGDGHKFYWAFTCKKDVAATVDISVWGGDYLASQNIGADWERRSYIISNDGANDFGFSSGAGLDFSIKDILIVDLTAIFGSGNEPSTVSAFEAWVAQQGFAGLTDFNPGQVLGNAAKSINTAGFQLWDEQWENGYWNAGTFVPNATKIASKNRISIFPSTTYYEKAPGTLNIEFYDADGEYIDTVYPSANTIFTSPVTAHFMAFTLDNTPVYENNICINLSGPRNGQYEPYVGAIDTIALNLSTLTGIPEGGSTSEVVFPLGLQSIGGVSDEIHGTKAIKRFGVVDLGDLTWDSTDTDTAGKNRFYARINTPPNSGETIVANILCSNYPSISARDTYYNIDGVAVNPSIYFNGALIAYIDAFSGYTAFGFKTAVEGVYLVYELTTPVEYELVEPLPALYETAEGGPEYIEGPAGTAPTTAPFVGEIRYSQPQADANGLAVAILDALKAASKISSYTFGIDPETSKPAITIS